MKWNQIMRRNAQGEVELTTTMSRDGETALRQAQGDKVTVNVLPESEAKLRIRHEDWQQMTDDDGCVYMQLSWEVPEERREWS
ncbi:hypothetical protein EGI31_12710 [Lacihabitans soyangensis]|uniref:Uncharacterized protein n=2 Tax=Lacihabitans soyangensis TaxID=869394 RepID=A0AAE3H4N0_9BACT|nr:hypothetical protein [Lacihabitans soyangensis]